MEKIFGIEPRRGAIVGENQLLEFLNPRHQGCGGSILIGQSSPGDNGNFKIICQECGARALMSPKQRRNIILALVDRRERRINEKVVVYRKGI